MTEDRNIETGADRRRDPLYFFVLVLASIFPILGFGAYFRNEDGRYLQWMREGFFNPFGADFIRTVETFRPVNWIILRAIYGTAGYSPFAYQLASAVCFVGAVMLMYAVGKRLFGSTRAAYLSILCYFACFYFTLHFLYTPIQGFQFPLELLLVTATVYLLLGVIPQGRFGWPVIAAAVLAVLAIFNHPVSGVLVPVLGIAIIAVGWRHCARGGRGREHLAAVIITLGFFAGLLLLIPVVTTQVKTDQGGVLGLIPVMIKRYGAYGSIFLRGINRILIPIPLVYLVARWILARGMSGSSPALRFWIGILASCAGVILFIILPPITAFALLTMLVAALACTGWQRLVLVLWFFAGMLPNLTSWVVTGVYMRHGAIALSLLAGCGYSVLIGDASMELGERAGRLRAALTLERSTGVLTLLAVIAVLIAGLHLAPVPVISRQIAQIEYLKDLGNNFRDTVEFLCGTLDEDTAVYFYRGPTRAEEDQYAYTSTHLERLQPAKSNHYQYYFAMQKREDIVVRFTAELAPGAAGAILVATNNWEVRELESTFSLETWREFRRGTTLARIYRLRSK
jgi:hypothetical protein